MFLRKKRGVGKKDLHKWLEKLRPINPHISKLDYIYPNENILIPDTLDETISDQQVWQNAFSGIPRELDSSQSVKQLRVFITSPSSTIDSIAKEMFSQTRYATMPLSVKRAILIHNNPDLKLCLSTNRVPAVTALDFTPLRLTEWDKWYWQYRRPEYMRWIKKLDPNTQNLYQQTGAEDICYLAELVAYLRKQGAAVGMDDAINASVAATSGFAAAAEATLPGINALVREIYDDAIKKMGPEATTAIKGSKKSLAKMGRFIKAHPKYPALMTQLKKTPQILLPMNRSALLPAKVAKGYNVKTARYFKKQYFQAFRQGSSGKYLSTIANQLNGRVGFYKSLGKHATWYIPAALGAYSVYKVPPEMRLKTLFTEGCGIVGGYYGTIGGLAIGMSLVGMLCLGPFGAFILMFLCASAGGYALSELSKSTGGLVYDIGDRFGNRIYHSVDELVGDFQ